MPYSDLREFLGKLAAPGNQGRNHHREAMIDFVGIPFHGDLVQ